MADRGLRDVEELVEASVFHPSPCRRLRENVLRKAVVARHRQRIGQRFAVLFAVAGGMGTVVFLIVVWHAEARIAQKPDAPISGGQAVQVLDSRSSLSPSSQIPNVPGESLGERLYRDDATIRQLSASVEAPPRGDSGSSSAEDGNARVTIRKTSSGSGE